MTKYLEGLVMESDNAHWEVLSYLEKKIKSELPDEIKKAIENWKARPYLKYDDHIIVIHEGFKQPKLKFVFQFDSTMKFPSTSDQIKIDTKDDKELYKLIESWIHKNKQIERQMEESEQVMRDARQSIASMNQARKEFA